MNLAMLFIGIAIGALFTWVYGWHKVIDAENDAKKWQAEIKKFLQNYNEITTAYEHEQMLVAELKGIVVDQLDIFKDVIHANQVHTGKRGSSVLRPETLNKLRWGVDQATENGWFEAWRKPLDVEIEATETPTEAQ